MRDVAGLGGEDCDGRAGLTEVFICSYCAYAASNFSILRLLPTSLNFTQEQPPYGISIGEAPSWSFPEEKPPHGISIRLGEAS